MTEQQDIREAVRARYAAAATRAGCCSTVPGDLIADECGTAVFGKALYVGEEAAEPALVASLGCGVPTAVADLHPGEVVLDLGSGAGADVLISARWVGPTGRTIGLDMTEEMLVLARANATLAGVTNAEFVKGYLEDVPLPAESVDVVISNCVLNLAADKTVVLAEAARVLRPGGRLAISDVIADEGMDEATKADMAAWTGCVAGALTAVEFAAALRAAGFTDLEIRPTHRVHTHAQAAIVRATLPPAPHTTEETTTTMPTGLPTGLPSELPTAGTAASSGTVEVFDPAMCCSSGVCGPTVDPALARFEADLRWLGTRGASVTRFNLAQQPGEFVARPVVAAMLASGGEDALPIVLVDGKVRFSGVWPSRADLAAQLGIPPVSPTGVGVGVGVDLLAPTGQSAEGCCTPTGDAGQSGCC